MAYHKKNFTEPSNFKYAQFSLSALDYKTGGVAKSRLNTGEFEPTPQCMLHIMQDFITKSIEISTLPFNPTNLFIKRLDTVYMQCSE